MITTFSEADLAVKLGGIEGIQSSYGSSFENLKSVSFDGVDAYLDRSDTTGAGFLFSSTDPFSIALWIKADNETDDRGYLFARQSSAIPNYQQGITIRIDYYGRLEFICASRMDAVVYNMIRSGTYAEFLDSAWHCLVFTSDGTDTSGMRMYADGSLISTTSVKNTGASGMDNPGPLRMGCSIHNLTQPYLGYLDEVSVWNVEFSAAQVAAMIDADTGTTPANLEGLSDPAFSNCVGWWRMGDNPDSYPEITDRVGAYDLTMTNQIAGDITEEVAT
jgi:hypothetical protein